MRPARRRPEDQHIEAVECSHGRGGDHRRASTGTASPVGSAPLFPPRRSCTHDGRRVAPRVICGGPMPAIDRLRWAVLQCAHRSSKRPPACRAGPGGRRRPIDPASWCETRRAPASLARCRSRPDGKAPALEGRRGEPQYSPGGRVRWPHRLRADQHRPHSVPGRLPLAGRAPAAAVPLGQAALGRRPARDADLPAGAAGGRQHEGAARADAVGGAQREHRTPTGSPAPRLAPRRRARSMRRRRACWC